MFRARRCLNGMKAWIVLWFVAKRSQLFRSFQLHQFCKWYGFHLPITQWCGLNENKIQTNLFHAIIFFVISKENKKMDKSKRANNVKVITKTTHLPSNDPLYLSFMYSLSWCVGNSIFARRLSIKLLTISNFYARKILYKDIISGFLCFMVMVRWQTREQQNNVSKQQWTSRWNNAMTGLASPFANI